MCRLRSSPPGRLGAPWLLWVLLASAAAQSRAEKSSSSPYGSAGDLAEQAGAYLRQLAREEAVVSVQKSLSQAAAAAGEALAAAVNVCSRYLSRLLAAVGLHDVIPLSQASAEGVVFVCQCLLLSLIGYWVISLLIRSLACSLRFGFWLLKVGGALAGFGLIVSDRSVAMETTAIRLTVLVLLCVLLGVGPWRGGARDDEAVRLANQVKTLERRVREMEKLIE